MNASRQIRGLIALYLADLIDLQMFADQFSDIFENIEESGDDSAVNLSYQVESLLAKASDEYISESDFFQGLRDCFAGFSATTDVISTAQAPKPDVKSYMIKHGELLAV
jgi:hypothetical protein